MLVKEIMTGDVKTIAPEATIQEAAAAMSGFGIGCLVVSKDDALSGIITERDIIARVVSADKTASKTRVSSTMTKDLYLIKSDATVEEAAELMTERRIKKLPVVEGTTLVGIITMADVVACEPKLIEGLAKIFLMPKKCKPVGG
jgi:CBS domain-containing protein